MEYNPIDEQITSIQNNTKYTKNLRLVPISLLRISLLQLFKTFHEYVAHAILYTIYFITAINLPNAIFG